jgi:hypothetical protein
VVLSEERPDPPTQLGVRSGQEGPRQAPTTATGGVTDVVGVFCIGKIQGGQDHAFLFRDGLVNYKAHYDLSWFRPLLGGNSPTSSGLILKMNNGYNGVSRELEKFAW